MRSGVAQHFERLCVALGQKLHLCAVGQGACEVDDLAGLSRSVGRNARALRTAQAMAELAVELPAIGEDQHATPLGT